MDGQNNSFGTIPDWKNLKDKKPQAATPPEAAQKPRSFKEAVANGSDPKEIISERVDSMTLGVLELLDQCHAVKHDPEFVLENPNIRDTTIEAVLSVSTKFKKECIIMLPGLLGFKALGQEHFIETVHAFLRVRTMICACHMFLDLTPDEFYTKPNGDFVKETLNIDPLEYMRKLEAELPEPLRAKLREEIDVYLEKKKAESNNKN